VKWCGLFAIVLALNITAFGGQEKEKEKVHEGTVVDSGSFGVFMGTHRVGTETFSIYQNNGGSVVESEFKTQGDKKESAQESEMHLTANGEIKRYDWRELSPGTASFSVIPNDQFLTQKWKMGPDDKEHEQPYLLSLSTSILDDYSFVQREVLAWKFLGAACKQDKGQVQCPVKQRAKFPTMNPHEHSSAPATMEYLGREKLTLNGTERDLNKLELKGESGTWLLWLDDHFKLQRILIEDANTQVIRD
jgi:hypothetical protein